MVEKGRQKETDRETLKERESESHSCNQTNNTHRAKETVTDWQTLREGIRDISRQRQSQTKTNKS